METTIPLDLPPDARTLWLKNSPRSWPKLMYEDLVDYLIHTKAYDGEALKAFRALYGYNYVESGWMGDIYSCKVDGVDYLKATVSPSQPGVGKSDYLTWIAVSDGSVVTGLCSCPAGKGRSCSHISAVIYGVTLAWKHGIAGETCTDRQRSWGQGGAAKSLTHDLLSDMTFSHQGENAEQPTYTCTKPRQLLDHDEVQSFVQNCDARDLWNCKGTMLNKVLKAPPCIVEVRSTINHSEHNINNSYPVKEPPKCTPCANVYRKYVELNQTQISQINQATCQQNNAMWFDARKFRLTASKAHSIPKTSRGDPTRVVNTIIYDRFKGCAATRHGQKFESVAKQWFENQTSLKVTEVGFVVSSDEPYIGASPDGLIGNDTIIEIKCPLKPVHELINSGKYDIFKQDGELVLNPKGKNGYYYQVQVTMFCTQRRKCKFVAWTVNEAVIVNVEYDEIFIATLLPRIRDFYFNHLLVRLVDEIKSCRMKISSDYKSLCALN